MTLIDYLEANGLKIPAFAAEHGFEKQTLYSYTQQRRIPEPEMMRRIFEATDGAVTPNDWVLPKTASAGGGVAAEVA